MSATNGSINYFHANELKLENVPLLSFATSLIYTLQSVLIKQSVLDNLPLPSISFNKSGTVYGSYQNRTVCTSANPFQHPETISEIQQIVHKAISNNLMVKALGSQHTDTELICTSGIPIKMNKIQFVQLNKDFTATIGAGTQLTDVMEELHKHGRTIVNTPSYGGITMGGLLGCASHGTSLIHPNIADLLVSLTIVDGTGKIQHITKSEDLNAFKAHLGLLGIIYSATIKTQPLFKMQIYNYPASDNLLLNGELFRMARNHDYFQFWWFPSDHSVVISKGDYLPTKAVGNASSYMIPNVHPALIKSSAVLMEIQNEMKNLRALRKLQSVTKLSLYGYSVGKPPIYSEDGKTLSNPAVGYAHRLMSNRCVEHLCAWRTHPFISALAIDVREMTKAVYTIKAILKESPAEFPLNGFYFRFATPSSGLMAVESARETVHIEWVEASRYDPFNDARAGLGANQAILQALISKHGGRPHWGKNGAYWFTQEFLEMRKPNLQKFRSYMRLYDPNGIFLNDIGKRILGTSNNIGLDPREKHCGLNDNCICKEDIDCGSKRDVKCMKVYGFNVCQKLETTDLMKYLNRISA